jgi:hypothetical protein
MLSSVSSLGWTNPLRGGFADQQADTGLSYVVVKYLVFLAISSARNYMVNNVPAFYTRNHDEL